ncbi:hypothetical protein Tcan_17009 [Toxocara canis]|uniref:Uncharacterized protein n=1 Tax=Toxocara canis TaxID=6265 RepID=A0A0B2UVR6_TOXCA|nr:hypothetical protein Tcan_17009 [Toxocara canis]
MAQMQCAQYERFEGDNSVNVANPSVDQCSNNVLKRWNSNDASKKSDSSTYMFKKFVSGDNFNNANNGFSIRPMMEGGVPSSGWQPFNTGYNSPPWTGLMVWTILAELHDLARVDRRVA